MAKELSKPGSTLFEQIRKVDDKGNEYWTSRDMAKVLEYSEYRHFVPVVDKARAACKISGHNVNDHFEEYLDMIEIGKGGLREIESVKLSRYACYLIVQNADPSKEVVALGQTYFAIQTRLRELQQMGEYNSLSTEDEKRLFLRNEMAKHNTLLAAAAKNAGVTGSLDYAIKKKGLKKSQQILDHMGSTELAANLFRATQTEEKLRRENIKGKQKANQTHYEVGKKVRRTIKDIGGTMPENLPMAESIKKVEGKSKPKLKKKKS